LSRSPCVTNQMSPTNNPLQPNLYSQIRKPEEKQENYRPNYRRKLLRNKEDKLKWIYSLKIQKKITDFYCQQPLLIIR
jgi:hypothetical protein